MPEQQMPLSKETPRFVFNMLKKCRVTIITVIAQEKLLYAEKFS